MLVRDCKIVADKRSAPEISLPHFLWLRAAKKVGWPTGLRSAECPRRPDISIILILFYY